MRYMAILKCSLRGAGGHRQGTMQLRDVLSQKLFPDHHIQQPLLALPSSSTGPIYCLAGGDAGRQQDPISLCCVGNAPPLC